ncbi:hypothetical protein AB6A40_011318 [Gnathostoma spinigerum]|uniref:Uncharacterized protein n=1 Tax=Gnathostoma spinigerum TaxID=75299 RepID=A0ABD6F1J3_9BILA
MFNVTILQGIMQGLFEVIGCLARGFGPMILTSLYEASGYLWPTVVHLTMLLIALALLIIFYKRFVPLKLIPDLGVATRYKYGVFYRL